LPTHAMHVLDCGTTTFPKSGLFFGGGDEDITTPTPAYVVTHPEGNVLFDAGFPLGCIDPPYFEGFPPNFRVSMTPEQHIVEQVKAAGFEPDTIRYVVQTHLHFDHVGAIGHFPNAEFLVSRADWDYAHNPDWFSGFAYPLRDIDVEGVKWTFLDDLTTENVHDIYGDGRIRLVLSPGHSPGQLSLIAKLDDSSWLLTSDAVATAAHWRDEALPFFLDAPAVVRSTARLRQFAEDENIALEHVLFGHDAEQYAALKTHTHAYT
jgi:N-acyl homoserine lactone hydrolase